MWNTGAPAGATKQILPLLWTRNGKQHYPDADRGAYDVRQAERTGPHPCNKNVLVVGGSGSGKTRFFIKPNLMQMHSSYVVTDPKGTVLIEVGKLLSRGTPKLDKDGNPVRGKNGKIVYEPYKIKVFNTINFSKSMHYNPFAYIHNEKDILKLVTVLIANTKGEGKSGDDFWVKAETLLYTALIGYIYYEAPTNEQNFSTLVEMINAMEVREDDESFKNAS